MPPRICTAQPILIIVLTLLAVPPAHAQWPPEVQNLQVLPDDIPFRDLVDVMAGFTRALAVRCSFCHVGEEGAPLSSYDFASDDKLTKRKARRMLSMVQAINDDHLSDLEERADPPVRVECATCHRAAQRPRMLQDVLSLAYDAGGYDSAVAVYRDLRERFYGRFTYDFSNIVLPDVATRLIEQGAVADAVQLLQFNVTLFPDSEFARRQYAIAALQQAIQAGGFDAAVARYHALREDGLRPGGRPERPRVPVATRRAGNGGYRGVSPQRGGLSRVGQRL